MDVEQQLKEYGLIISDFGGTSIQVSEVPELLTATHDIRTLLLESAQAISAEDNKNPLESVRHDMLALLACHGAIRAGQKLSIPEMKQVLTDLGKCQNPYNCPHGRPVSWTLGKNEVEKQFKRII